MQVLHLQVVAKIRDSDLWNFLWNESWILVWSDFKLLLE